MKSHRLMPFVLALSVPTLLTAPKVAQAGIWTWMETHIQQLAPSWSLLEWGLLMIGLG